MMHKKMLCLLVMLIFAITPGSALAKGSFGGGGGSKSFSSGGSKPSSSGGYKPSSSGGSKSYSSGTKPMPSIAKPSTGSKPQPAPVTKLIPSSPPPKLTGSTGRPKFQPAGRDYYRDRRTVLSNPAYANPYGASYYGSFNSPFFYLWMFSIMDNDGSNNPLPPESDDRVDTSILSYMQVIQAMQEQTADKR